MRILVAEDDFTSRLMLEAMLKKWGYAPLMTENGQAAWAALQQPDAPQLMLLDWNMPELDGLDVVRLLREQNRSQPPYVIILTARNNKRDIVEGLRAGANDYVAKPYDVEELQARLAVGCRMVEMQRLLAEQVQCLQDALDQIKTLRGIVPICMHCKKIRDDKGFWSQVEVYVRKHSEAEFSHGICPECMHRLYPDLEDEDEADANQSHR